VLLSLLSIAIPPRYEDRVCITASLYESRGLTVDREGKECIRIVSR
jgi:hypothetical protein